MIEYIKWRQDFYEKNGVINLLITETEKGFFLSKTKLETLVGTLRNAQSNHAIVFTATE